MIIKIAIPEENSCLVKSGQHVDLETPFLETLSSVDIDVPLAKTLGIPPSKIFRYLKRFVGETTKKGEVIANKKGLFSSQTVLSEQDGTIKEINHSEGTIIVSVTGGEKTTIPAFFKGEVVEIKNHVISLNVKEGKEFSLKKASCDFGSHAIYLHDDSERTLGNTVSKKIVVVRSLSSYSQAKAEALGACGFVCASDLPDETSVPYAVLNNPTDLKRIFELNLPFCLVDKKSSTIYFYT